MAPGNCSGSVRSILKTAILQGPVRVPVSSLVMHIASSAWTSLQLAQTTVQMEHLKRHSNRRSHVLVGMARPCNLLAKEALASILQS